MHKPTLKSCNKVWQVEENHHLSGAGSWAKNTLPRTEHYLMQVQAQKANALAICEASCPTASAVEVLPAALQELNCLGEYHNT